VAGDAAPLRGSVFSGNERPNLWRDHSHWEQEEEGREADAGRRVEMRRNLGILTNS